MAEVTTGTKEEVKEMASKGHHGGPGGGHTFSLDRGLGVSGTIDRKGTITSSSDVSVPFCKSWSEL